MKIYLTKHANKQLQYYVDSVDSEISGLGEVEIYQGMIVIKKLMIFKQEVSSAHTTLDSEEVAKFIYKKFKKKENVENLKLWWHSHNSMDSFFSGTDDDTIEEEAKTGRDYMISIVSNNDGEVKGRIDFYKPFRATIDCDVEVIEEDDPQLRTQIEKEVKKLVSEPSTYTADNTYTYNKNSGVLPYRKRNYKDDYLIGKPVKDKDKKAYNEADEFFNETCYYCGGTLDIPTEKEEGMCISCVEDAETLGVEKANLKGS